RHSIHAAGTEASPPKQSREPRSRGTDFIYEIRSKFHQQVPRLLATVWRLVYSLPATRSSLLFGGLSTRYSLPVTTAPAPRSPGRSHRGRRPCARCSTTIGFFRDPV